MSLRTRWITLALAFLLTVCSSLVGHADVVHADTKYVVHKGDTLWQIAKKHDTSVIKLKQANHLTSDTLLVHQTIRIPTSNAKTHSHAKPAETQFLSASKSKESKAPSDIYFVLHTVQPGDTLWHLAIVNNTSVANLMSMNHLTSDVIFPGQKLRVYKGSKKAFRAATLKHYSSVGLPIRLIPVYQAAGKKYGIPWTVLAAIHRVETHFSTGYVVSSAGAQGPMQFMPATFRAYAVLAPGRRGHPNIDNVYDAIYTCAHMLAADGYRQHPRLALYDYNHSFSYVNKVLGYSRLYEV